MTASTETPADPDRDRAIYDEYLLDDSMVGMLSDPLNEHAWIYTTDPTPVER